MQLKNNLNLEPTMRRSEENNKTKTDFIEFLNQNFSVPKNQEAEEILEKPAVVHEKKLKYKDEEILLMLKATVSPKRSRLKHALNNHLGKPEIDDIEEHLVMNWIKNALKLIGDIWQQALKLAGARKKKKGNIIVEFRKNLFPGKKIKQGRGFAARDGIFARPWKAGVLMSCLGAFIFALALSNYMPAIAISLSDRLDRIIVYPIIVIARETSHDYRNSHKPKSPPLAAEKKPIDKKMMANYILKHKAALRNENYESGQGIKVNEEELRGRVLGAAVAEQPAEPVIYIENHSYPDAPASFTTYPSGQNKQETVLRRVYSYVQDIIAGMAIKQMQVSDNLNNKLLDLIKKD